MSKPILSQSDIRTIKRYIQAKYDGETPQRLADILAETVHRILNAHLPGFDDRTKQELRSRLLSRSAMLERKSLAVEDIFDECIRLELDRDERSEQLLRWLRETVGIELDPVQLQYCTDSYRRQEEGLRQTPLDETLRQLASSMDSGAAAVPIGSPPAVAIENGSSWLSDFAARLRARSVGIVAVVLSFALIGAIIFYSRQTLYNNLQEPAEWTSEELRGFGFQSVKLPNELPAALQYDDFDPDKLKAYLLRKNSLLASEPYYSAIVKAGAHYNVNPLLLFAITGQEQGFVPKSGKQSSVIANNPFNVFHSWSEYNTTIEDSASIAAKLLVQFSRDRPASEHPLAWINRKYAEDPKWWQGVDKIFAALVKATGQSHKG